jgi:hypothetical protein
MYREMTVTPKKVKRVDAVIANVRMVRCPGESGVIHDGSEGGDGKKRWGRNCRVVLEFENGSHLSVSISDSRRDCCEDYGVVLIPPGAKPANHMFAVVEQGTVAAVKRKLIGTTVRSFRIAKKQPDGWAVRMEEGGCVVVHLSTSEGVLKLVAFNSHNGYYCHRGVVEYDSERFWAARI